MALVAGYELALDRRYDPDTNLWVQECEAGCVRIGYDPLGAETTGDIVAISFAPLGERVTRGEALATVEAAKFVGPLPAPVGGVLLAVSEDVLAAPGTINGDPLGTWLVELADVAPTELERLLNGPDEVTPWFEAAVERFRREGAIAEP
jgi:glycine cleavage system H protein